MPEPALSVREIEEKDIGAIADYWLGADARYLQNMGADINKLPPRQEWTAMLGEQISSPMEEKQAYCIIWEADGQAVGHSNINKITFGQEAYMHLHLWGAGQRKQGMGSQLVHLTLPYFFENFKLQKLCCEIYVLNIAPNKALERAGFEFISNYTTIPGWINFEQQVSLWELSYEKFQSTT